jgi:hypothetical protein
VDLWLRRIFQLNGAAGREAIEFDQKGTQSETRSGATVDHRHHRLCHCWINFSSPDGIPCQRNLIIRAVLENEQGYGNNVA